MDRETFKLQQRPEWCLYRDCIFTRNFYARCGAICSGKLPKPDPHEEGFNTYQLCFLFIGNKEKHSPAEAFAMRVNDLDLDLLRWVFDALDGKKTSSK